ncbi:MAG: hypothetical protein ACFFCQ_06670 [Promethearchaeota archaeon]
MSTSGHYSRKLVHIGNGIWCFLLPFIPRYLALCVVMIAIFMDLFLFRPHRWRAAFEFMAREEDYQAGFLIGPTIYILVVFTLVLLFDIRVAAAAFAMMAFGDGFATVIGAKFGRLEIGTKSVEGTMAFIFGGFFFSLIAFYFVEIFGFYGGEGDFAIIKQLILSKLPSLHIVILLIAAVTILAALMELLLAEYVNDNILVPGTTAIFLTLTLISL